MDTFAGAGAIGFILALALFVVVQRFVHREVQSLLLLVFQRPALVVALFSLLLLPGVFVHEMSHLLTALLLGVPVSKFSLIPKTLKNGHLRLGYVETQKTDRIRDSLIGLAPFVAGLLLVAVIGSAKLGLDNLYAAVMTGTAYDIFEGFGAFFRQPDLGIWLYLVFCISSAMIPSASDRQSWKVIALGIGIVLLLLLLAGSGEWIFRNVSPRLDAWLFSISLIILSSTIIHLLILLPTWILRMLVSRITGLRVVRNGG